MKARTAAGDAGRGARLLASIEPFMFRRWLDYATIDAIREMKDKIDRASRASEEWEPDGRRNADRGRIDRSRALEEELDVKLGRGGIRELEFFVQALQLVNAGKRAEVRSATTLDALGRLAAAGLVGKK